MAFESDRSWTEIAEQVQSLRFGGGDGIRASEELYDSVGRVGQFTAVSKS
jgi:hypothetical protein